MKKLILVKEFPNIFTLHPNLLQDILRLVWKLYIEMFKVHKYSEVVCHWTPADHKLLYANIHIFQNKSIISFKNTIQYSYFYFLKIIELLGVA